MKFKSFGGTFPKAMEKIFSPAELAKYDSKKDYAILSIAAPEKVDKNLQRANEAEYKLFNFPGVSVKQIADQTGMHPKSIFRKRKQLELALNMAPVG